MYKQYTLRAILRMNLNEFDKALKEVNTSLALNPDYAWDGYVARGGIKTELKLQGSNPWF